MAATVQPVIRVDELALRPWTGEDVPAIVDAYGEYSIQRWHARSMTPSEAEIWVQEAHRGWTDETSASWAIVDQGMLVGRMSLRRIELADGVAELGYWVTAPSRGRGIASRALTAVTDWSFSVLGLHRIELEHSTKNPASCAVATKAGYLLEGVKRSSALHDDGWHDMHLHARLDNTSDPAPAND